MLIKPINLFKGTFIERNNQRIEAIERLTMSEYMFVIIKHLFHVCKDKENRNNKENFQKIIEYELFFEKIENVQSWKIDKLYNAIYDNNITEEDFIDEYKITGREGLLKTILMLGL